MFKSLQDFFSSKSSSGQNRQSKVKKGSKKDPNDNDLKLAAATLMFEVVRSDGKIDRTELIAMGEVLRSQFKIDEEDIQTMVDLAQKTSQEATSLQGFTRDICDNWGNAKRAKLLEHLWVIALADKTIDAHERHMVRKVAGLLYLNEMQIVQARENAKATLGIEDF